MSIMHDKQGNRLVFTKDRFIFREIGTIDQMYQVRSIEFNYKSNQRLGQVTINPDSGKIFITMLEVHEPEQDVTDVSVEIHLVEHNDKVGFEGTMDIPENPNDVDFTPLLPLTSFATKEGGVASLWVWKAPDKLKAPTSLKLAGDGHCGKDGCGCHSSTLKTEDPLNGAVTANGDQSAFNRAISGQMHGLATDGRVTTRMEGSTVGHQVLDGDL